jgi:hypothetical protein
VLRSLLRLNEKTLKQTIYYFGGFAPVVTGLLGTSILDYNYRRQGLDKKQRSGLVFQEGITQAINIGFHLLSYFGLGLLLKRSLKTVPIQPRSKELLTILGANVGGLLGAAILRPLIGSKIVSTWIKKDNAQEVAVKQSETAAKHKLDHISVAPSLYADGTSQPAQPFQQPYTPVMFAAPSPVTYPTRPNVIMPPLYSQYNPVYPV